MEASEPSCVGVDPADWQAQMAARAAREARGEGKCDMTDAEMATEFRGLRRAMAERDWKGLSPSQTLNIFRNYLGQSPLFGYEHPAVKLGLGRAHECTAQASNAMRGVLL